jgi:hypothetical protein
MHRQLAARKPVLVAGRQTICRTLSACLVIGIGSVSVDHVKAQSLTSHPQTSETAATSACSAGPWKPGDSGHAPRGFLTGMGLVYRRNFCEVTKNMDSASQDMSRPEKGKPFDIFGYFKTELAQNAVSLKTKVERLRALYTLAIGIGMNESDGNPTAGPYIKDNPVKAEAGLFQMSYDSLTASPSPSKWLSKLYTFYQTHPQTCLQDTFMKGISDDHAAPIGSGAPKHFQIFTKDCPAFAAEYGLVMMRVKATYFGTIIGTNPGGHSNKAQFVPACYNMLKDLETSTKCD